MSAEINRCLDCALQIENKDILGIDVLKPVRIQMRDRPDAIQVTLNNCHFCENNIRVDH
jgi:hypothetical protein